MKKTIKILNTNLSNLQSIKYAIEGLGYNVENVDNIKSFNNDEIVVIPGVGNYSQAMQNLKPNFSNLNEIADLKNLRILGICLGMQLLFSSSEEGDKNGLEFIPGKVQKLDKLGVSKIPNIGWRKVQFSNSEYQKFSNEYFYFVHSYAAVPESIENVLGTTLIDGSKITAFASNEKNKIGRYVGCQFHPEKSGVVGLKFLDCILKDLLEN